MVLDVVRFIIIGLFCIRVVFIGIIVIWGFRNKLGFMV